MGRVRLPMLGAFNISNAAAAIAAAMESGIDFETAARSLSEFSGIGRRLERIGEWRGRAVFYDYAHHPTEIKASIGRIPIRERATYMRILSRLYHLPTS